MISPLLVLDVEFTDSSCWILRGVRSKPRVKKHGLRYTSGRWSVDSVLVREQGVLFCHGIGLEDAANRSHYPQSFVYHVFIQNVYKFS